MLTNSSKSCLCQKGWFGGAIASFISVGALYETQNTTRRRNRSQKILNTSDVPAPPTPGRSSDTMESNFVMRKGILLASVPQYDPFIAHSQTDASLSLWTEDMQIWKPLSTRP